MLAGSGNYLGKMRSNFFIGLRTPWPLSSERSWRRTHRWAGRVFVAVGLAMAVSALTPAPGQAMLALTGVLLLACLALVAYSYVVWRGDAERG